MAEIGRRIVHASGILIPAVYLAGLVTWGQLRVLLVLGSVLALLLEWLRLRVGLDWWIYRHLTRPYEAETIAGYGLYMLSTTAVALIFGPDVAIPAMLMLMVGDPVSGYLGSGELRPVKRPLAMAGMFVVSVVVTVPFTLAVLDRVTVAIGVAIAGAVAGTVADAIKPTIRSYVIDDNLTIPAFAAVALWVAYRTVGWL